VTEEEIQHWMKVNRERVIDSVNSGMEVWVIGTILLAPDWLIERVIQEEGL
jgi:hypothetical protein